jgi:hypothetical protein
MDETKRVAEREAARPLPCRAGRSAGVLVRRSGVVALSTTWRATQQSAMQHQFKPARNYRQFGTWRRACLPGDLNTNCRSHTFGRKAYKPRAGHGACVVSGREISSIRLKRRENLMKISLRRMRLNSSCASLQDIAAHICSDALLEYRKSEHRH